MSRSASLLLGCFLFVSAACASSTPAATATKPATMGTTEPATSATSPAAAASAAPADSRAVVAAPATGTGVPLAKCDNGTSLGAGCTGEINFVGVGDHEPLRGVVRKEGKRIVLELNACTCVANSTYLTKTDKVELDAKKIDATLVGKVVMLRWTSASMRSAEQGGSGSAVLGVEKIEPAK